MEKSIARKTKTIQMKYPAPYSQSWNSPETEKKTLKGKRKTKNISSLIQENPFPRYCRRNTPNPLHGPEPYAPHLKYGIFPRQSAPKTGSLMATVNARASVRNTMNPGTVPERASKEVKKANKAQLHEAPLFVIRPLNKQHRRHLSVSETLHLDIKPRRNLPQSPIRKPSPLLKHAIPRMSSNYDNLKILSE